MIKSLELVNPKSCLNKADKDEMLFVLLARDAAATHAIKAWIDKRIELGLNTTEDEQIEEALKCIETMRMQRSHREKVKIENNDDSNSGNH